MKTKSAEFLLQSHLNTSEEQKSQKKWVFSQLVKKKGHGEPREWTAKQWEEHQNIHMYDQMNDLWVEIDTIFRQNPWGPDGIEGNALKMAFMACFNVDKLKIFVFDTTFLSRFNVPTNRIEQCKTDDVEMMKIGFDWVKYFLTGDYPLTPKS